MTPKPPIEDVLARVKQIHDALKGHGNQQMRIDRRALADILAHVARLTEENAGLRSDGLEMERDRDRDEACDQIATLKADEMYGDAVAYARGLEAQIATLKAERALAVEGLNEVLDMAPATQEVCLASMMADIARTTLSALNADKPEVG